MYGENIKETRITNGYTQIQVSQATGIPQNTISWIEKNKGIANIQQCVQLADFYGITIDELIGRDYEKTKNAVIYNHSTHNGDNKF